MPGIGRELDAGADLAELARLLEDDDAEVLARQSESGRESAKAAPGHHDRLGSARDDAYTHTCST
jgi:hypothetical protein